MKEDKSKPKFPVPEAKGLCKKCIEKESKMIDETLLTCYCKHNLTGGLYQADLGIWRLSTPISPDDFKRLSQALIAGIKEGKEILKRENKISRRKFH